MESKRSAPKKKVNLTKVLPSELLKEVASYLHPVNRVALRQTSKKLHGDIERYPTKRSVIPTLRGSANLLGYERNQLGEAGPYNVTNTNLNRILMRSSGRKWMRNAEARKYLERMFTHTGDGNLFGEAGAMANAPSNKPLLFPGMHGAVPTQRQRLALAKAITSDTSNAGTRFIHKLIQKIRTRRRSGFVSTYYRWPRNGNKVRHLSPRSMASMHSKRGPGRIKVLN